MNNRSLSEAVPETAVVSLDAAISAAQDHLLSLQAADGYWSGELEADVSVASGYIPVRFALADDIDSRSVESIARYVRNHQNSDGSFSVYEGGPGDVSVTAQAYFAMKLGGFTDEETWVRRARQFIIASGGTSTVNTITKFWLAAFGQLPWDLCPAVPPEILLLPGWVPLNLYDFASWSRATIVALSVLWATKPTWTVPASADITDLCVGSGSVARHRGTDLWSRLFRSLDAFLKWRERRQPGSLRRRSLRLAEEWITAHQEADGSWAGIMLPWIYSLLALKSLGYENDHPILRKGAEGIDRFLIEDGEGMRLQPATSPVWDTAWAVRALADSGVSMDHSALRAAGEWLLDHHTTSKGEGARKVSVQAPACWSFEFVNTLFPDADDTAVVPMSLRLVGADPVFSARQADVVGGAGRWLRAMQGSDGGWAAFDRNNNRRMLTRIPFADFMSPLDPACADVTAHVLESLSGLPGFKDCVRRGAAYLRKTQRTDGSWYGRWGVNYVYGTSHALSALAAAGEPMDSPSVLSAVRWLEDCQNDDGGWGESCGSYADQGLAGTGASTASQTAWAVIGLVAAGRHGTETCKRGVEYLLSKMSGDGSWNESAYTGTGFPGVFMLRYHLYPIYFPLLALGRYRSAMLLEGLSDEEKAVASVAPSERVLLLSHCMRRAATCKAEHGDWGLECRRCNDTCSINLLTAEARRLGYGGICVAPGGSMAVRYVAKIKPAGIIAVACLKELSEGVNLVGKIPAKPDPRIAVVPLSKDGCINTEVDMEQALRALRLGCPTCTDKTKARKLP